MSTVKSKKIQKLVKLIAMSIFALILPVLIKANGVQAAETFMFNGETTKVVDFYNNNKNQGKATNNGKYIYFAVHGTKGEKKDTTLYRTVGYKVWVIVDGIRYTMEFKLEDSDVFETITEYTPSNTKDVYVIRRANASRLRTYFLTNSGKNNLAHALYSGNYTWNFDSIMTTVTVDSNGNETLNCGSITYVSGKYELTSSNGNLYRTLTGIQGAAGWGDKDALKSFYGIKTPVPANDVGMDLAYDVTGKIGYYYNNGTYYLKSGGQMSVKLTGEVNQEDYVANKVRPDFFMLGMNYNALRYFYNSRSRTSANTDTTAKSFTEYGNTFTESSGPFSSTKSVSCSNNKTTMTYTLTNNMPDTAISTINGARTICYYNDSVPSDPWDILYDSSSEEIKTGTYLAHKNRNIGVNVISDTSGPSIPYKPGGSIISGIALVDIESITDLGSGIKRIDVLNTTKNQYEYTNIYKTYTTTSTKETITLPFGDYQLIATDNVGNETRVSFSIKKPVSYKNTFTEGDGWNPNILKFACNGGDGYLGQVNIGFLVDDNEDKLQGHIGIYNASGNTVKENEGFISSTVPWEYFAHLSVEDEIKEYEVTVNPLRALQRYMDSEKVALPDGYYTVTGYGSSSSTGTSDEINATKKLKFDFNPPTYSGSDFSTSTSGGSWKTTLPQNGITLMDGASGPTIGKGKIVVKKYDNNDKVVASILGDSISGSGSTGFGSTKYIRYFDYTEAVDDVTPWSKVTDTITQGKNKYAVECSDNAGNNGTLYLYYKYDSVAPEVSVTLNNATASDYTSVVKRDDGNFDLYIGADGKIPSGLNINLRDNTSGVSNVTIRKYTYVNEKLGSGGTSNYYTYTNFTGQIYYGSYDYSVGGYTSKTAVDVFSGDDVANKITSGNITKGPPYRIEITTTDNAGNSVTKKVYIHVDNTAPKLFVMSEGGYKNNAFSGTRTILKNDMITEIKKYDNSSTGKTESLTTTSTLGWYQKDIGMMFCVMNDDEKELKECYIECATTGKKYNITSSEVYTQTGYDNQYALVGVHTSYATKLSVPEANRRYYFKAFAGEGDNNDIVNTLLGGKDEGQFYCRLVATDYAGNTATSGFYIKLDKTPPRININSASGKNGYNYSWTDEFEIQDALSGFKNASMINASNNKFSFELMKCPDGGIADYTNYNQTAGLNSTKKWYFKKTNSTNGPFQSVYVKDAAGNEATLDITKTDKNAPTVKCIYGYNIDQKDREDWDSAMTYASAKFEDESKYKLNCNPAFVKVNFQDILPENPGAKDEISGLAYCEVAFIKDEMTTNMLQNLYYKSDDYYSGHPELGDDSWGKSYGDYNGVWFHGDKTNTSGYAITDTKDGIYSILVDTSKWDGLHTRFRITCVDIAGNEYTTYSEPLIFDRKKPEYSVKYNGCTDDAGTTWNPSSVDITMRTNLLNYKTYSITNDFSGSENQIISTNSVPYIRPYSAIGPGGYLGGFTNVYENKSIFSLFTSTHYPGTSAKKNIATTIATEEHNTITLDCKTVMEKNDILQLENEEIKLNIDRTLPVIPEKVKAEGEGGEEEYQLSFERNADDTILTVKTDNISDALSGIKQVDIKVCKTDGTVVKEYEDITVDYSDETHKQGSFSYKIPVSDLGGAGLNDLVAHVYARDVANNYGFVAKTPLGKKQKVITINSAKIRRHVPSLDIFKTSFTRGEFGHVDLDIDCENGAYITKIEVLFPENFDVPYYEEGQPYYERTKDQRMNQVLEFDPPITEFKDSVDFYVPLDNMVPMNYKKSYDADIGQVRGKYNPDKFGDVKEYASMRDTGRIDEYVAKSKENKMLYWATVKVYGYDDEHTPEGEPIKQEGKVPYDYEKESNKNFKDHNAGEILYPDLTFTVKNFSLRRTVKAFNFGSTFQRLYKKYHWTSITDVTDYWSKISEDKYGMKRFQ